MANNQDKFWGLLNALTRDEFLQESYEIDRDPKKVAEEFNCKVILPKSDQLQIDIDCEQQYNFFRGRLADLEDMDILHVKETEETPSKSGLPKRHITLTCDRNFSESERIAIQFALGSDIIRETLNTLRLLASDNKDSGCCFFEPIENGEK